MHVSVQAETEASVRLKFSIRDTGIGIAPEAQAKIFESFTQADQSTTRRFGGTGLGTTIAKQLVRLMGGRIGLESAIGLGSTFWVEIDLEKQPEQAGGRQRRPGRRPHPAGRLPGRASARRSRRRSAAGARRRPRSAPAWRTASRAWWPRSASPSPITARCSTPRARTCSSRSASAARRPNPAPPTVLAVPRDADVRRFEVLSSGFASVLELPFDKRRLFNVLHSVAAGDEVHEGVVRLQDYARRAPRRAKLRVLVADDNPTNREVVGKILERSGHTVTLVNDGEQALDAIERDAHDIVMLDRNMPGMGGMEALQALRLMTRGRERLPVIMLSADVTPEAKREALEAGADAFLSKPIEAMRLLDEIQRLCRREARAGTGARRSDPGATARRAPRAAAPAVVNAETLGHLEELGSSLAFVEKLIRVFLADTAAILERIEKGLAGTRLPRVPLAGARDEGLVGEHGHRPADAQPARASAACPTPSCGCRRRRCCARSATRSPPRASQLERYLRERRKSTG